MPPRSPRAPETGATLLEVLAALLLLGLVVGGLLPLLSTGQLIGEETDPRQAMSRTARVALDRLLREVRAAESFRTLAPGVIRFTLFWGNGTGAAPTVEYSLNGATGELEYRWRDNWDYRRQITVRARDAVPAGYSVVLQFNHAALVRAGRSLASGDDVRVRSWTGTRLVELDRVVDPDPLHGWNQDDTRIWFRLQTAMADGTTNANYYLYYGNPAAGPPPANGDHVFLVDEDGTAMYTGEWIRRDTRDGTYSASPGGLRFVDATPGSPNAYRQLSKALVHDDVEILWGFVTVGSSNNGRQVGMSARLSDAGEGYWVTPGRTDGDDELRLWESPGWGNPGTPIDDQGSVAIANDVRYLARLQLLGRTFRARIWQEGNAEPRGWLSARLQGAFRSSGNHIALVNGVNDPMDHRSYRIIVRTLVDREPQITLGPEVAGARNDPLAALGGPFRSLTVACLDDAGTAISCATPALVRTVEVTLVAMDPAGRVPDMMFRGRAMRQSP